MIEVDVLFQVLTISLSVAVILIGGFRHLGKKIDKTNEMLGQHNAVIASLVTKGESIEKQVDETREGLRSAHDRIDNIETIIIGQKLGAH